jgi:hypothetical protein
MPENLLNAEDAPKDVTQAMQEPLVTRWWTIGSLAQFATKYLNFFAAIGQGLLQNDKDRCEGKYYCVQPAFIGLHRLDSRQNLPYCGSHKVLVKPTHAVVPGLGPSHRHTRVSLFPPAGSIFPNDGQPEEDGNELA